MPKKFLHVGCGQAKKDSTTPIFNTDDWTETRLDIDSSVNPDIVASIQDMSMILDNSYDAIFSSHNIEHIYAHEVINTLLEFKRILKDDGFLILTCPDIKSVCSFISDGNINKKLYDSPAGPIYPLDVIYGHRSSVASGKEFMAHKNGFTSESLTSVITYSKFKSYCIAESKSAFALWLIAYKNISCDDEKLFEDLKKHILPN